MLWSDKSSRLPAYRMSTRLKVSGKWMSVAYRNCNYFPPVTSATVIYVQTGLYSSVYSALFGTSVLNCCRNTLLKTNHTCFLLLCAVSPFLLTPCCLTHFAFLSSSLLSATFHVSSFPSPFTATSTFFPSIIHLFFLLLSIVHALFHILIL